MRGFARIGNNEIIILVNDAVGSLKKGKTQDNWIDIDKLDARSNYNIIPWKMFSYFFTELGLQYNTTHYDL